MQLGGASRERRTSRTLHALAITVGLLLAVAGAAGATQTRPTSTPGTVSYLTLTSKALKGKLGFAVYTPPGYASGSTRYPVIYFLHGLPASATAYRSQAAFVARHLDQIGARAIAVVPQGARAGDADPEYFDWGPGRNWQTALTVELRRYVDAHYRTIASRTGRAIVGISAGGYGAMVLGLYNPEQYSVVEAWSGYFVARNIKGDAALDLGEDSLNLRGSAFSVVSALRGIFRRLPTYLAFYIGRSDSTFYDSNRIFDDVLALLDVPHTYAVYPGGHTNAVWNAHADDWLTRALAHLAPAR